MLMAQNNNKAAPVPKTGAWAQCRWRLDGRQDLASHHSDGNRSSQITAARFYWSFQTPLGPPVLTLLTFAGFAIRLQGESHRTAAAHPCGSVLTCPVAATIVHSTGLCTWWERWKKTKKGSHSDSCLKTAGDSSGAMVGDKASCPERIEHGGSYGFLVLFHVALSTHKWKHFMF